MSPEELFEKLVADLDNRFDMSERQIVDALRWAVLSERSRRKEKNTK